MHYPPYWHPWAYQMPPGYMKQSYYRPPNYGMYPPGYGPFQGPYPMMDESSEEEMEVYEDENQSEEGQDIELNPIIVEQKKEKRGMMGVEESNQKTAPERGYMKKT
mmetsp:Transcript_25871/g.25144  ORF Transcript_25871/g.25144 Transcript_25871/m.25144 type:complete len:106 (+) Transcript_25871:2197-2514(+)